MAPVRPGLLVGRAVTERSAAGLVRARWRIDQDGVHEIRERVLHVGRGQETSSTSTGRRISPCAPV